MNLSYWEIKNWLSHIDFTIVGSGIVGLSCALQLKNRFPKAKIVIIEKGILPQGASTKNAGFACFGSLSEIIDDLKYHTEEEVLNLIQNRINGLQLLRKTLGDRSIDYQNLGGYELFSDANEKLYCTCVDNLKAINHLLNPIFNTEVFSFRKNMFGFKHIKSNCSFNSFEGQIDTGKMMNALLNKVQALDIKILNNTTIDAFSEDINSVKLKTNHFNFSTKKLCIATNGFASQLNIPKVNPARAQVVITKPINNLPIKGTFHLDEGFYYFRNIDNRILLGGGRNLDFKTEETTEFGQTEIIQKKLEALLKTTILPNTNFEIEHRWSGIMGVGKKKKPIVKQLSNNVFCGVRLGGMGVAIGSIIGKELAELVE
ncbi:NAD(P)/FAD-dependent oxidoreductase [Winogradskyella bathintestinalis]|uniref:FAD-dependent oxidoreductase n=1 Tax=Winogradskyella bathintestinalis TaxID=3035208 RepID=A0ABT7ZR76_9FLAO|nr:FAD-dependent oxidoreductase [Winogradskyella bathintestinalis]MDN3491494.1 FAD-dependent oxidoreductase [Winogradskyella bathintestinalis]